MDAAVQEIREERHEDPTDAGVSHRERVRPEQEGGPHLISSERRAEADRVAPQQVELQRPDVCVGNGDVRQFAEARLDPVREGASRDDGLEGPAARVHAFRRGRGEAHRFALAGDGDDVVEVERPSVDRTHGGPPRHPGSAIKLSRGVQAVKHPRAFGNPSMQIVFLGTSGSWPTPRRNVSAVALKRGPEVLLFDCGEGTQRQFMLSKLSFMQVSRVFVSHFHGDHFLGLPGMVQSMSMNGREAPLEVYGPRGIERLVGELLSLGYFTPGFAVHAKELPPGGEIDCGEYVVRAFEAVHTVPCVSFVLEEKTRPGRFSVDRAEALGIPSGPLYRQLQAGEPVTIGGRTIRPEDVLGPPRRGRKIVYTGDTMPHETLLEMARL